MPSPADIKPPFTLETATAKMKGAEALWNTRDPDKVVLAYSEDTEWRNRDVFLKGREEIRAFLKAKWTRELDYRLEKTLFIFVENKIAVQFMYECRTSDDQWWRSYGIEHWTFNDDGLMTTRTASVSDVEIDEADRRLIAP
ncbi:MAG: nuclear transport factor 2 family protein [Pseudomonadota bacterium]